MKFISPSAAILFICLSTSLVLQNNISISRTNLFFSPLYSKKSVDVIFIPLNSSLFTLLAPADRNLLGDLVWMRTAYYFGTHAVTDKQYPYLLHLINLNTDLSSKWISPYYFGAIILPTEANSTAEGFYIIEKGIQQFPSDWRLWFFKGYYEWKIFNDPINAAATLRHASLLPEAPEYLLRLPATLANKSGQRELAIHFLQESLMQAQDERQKKILLEKINEVLREQ